MRSPGRDYRLSPSSPAKRYLRRKGRRETEGGTARFIPRKDPAQRSKTPPALSPSPHPHSLIKTQTTPATPAQPSLIPPQTIPPPKLSTLPTPPREMIQRGEHRHATLRHKTRFHRPATPRLPLPGRRAPTQSHVQQRHYLLRRRTRRVRPRRTAPARGLDPRRASQTHLPEHPTQDRSPSKNTLVWPACKIATSICFSTCSPSTCRNFCPSSTPPP